MQRRLYWIIRVNPKCYTSILVRERQGKIRQIHKRDGCVNRERQRIERGNRNQGMSSGTRSWKKQGVNSPLQC